MAISMPRKEGDKLFLTSTFGHSTLLTLDANEPKAKIAWKGTKTTGFDSVFATPWVEGDHIYGTSSNGDLRCIKAEDGKVLWSTMEPNGNRKNARSADIFIVKNGDRFFLYNELGDLIIALMSPQGYKQISKAHLLNPTQPRLAEMSSGRTRPTRTGVSTFAMIRISFAIRWHGNERAGQLG